MSWIYVILISHGSALLVLLGTLSLFLFRAHKTRVDRVFTGLLLSFMGWISFDGLSQFYTHFFEPYWLFGTLGGVSIQFIAFHTYAFCLLYPEGRTSRRGNWSILAAFLVAILMSALTFHPKWISNRHVVGGTAEATYGPFFYLVSIYAICLILSGMGILLFRYFRRSLTDRQRSHIRLFLWGALVSLLIAVTFSFILPVLGYAKFFFLGPDGCLVFLSLLIYSMLTHRLFDLKTAALRIGLITVFYLVTGILAAWGFNHLLAWTGLASRDTGLVFLTVIFFLVASLIARRVLPVIDRKLIPEAPEAEELFVSLIGHRKFEDYNQPLSSYLRDTLLQVDALFPSEQSFMIARDRAGELIQAHIARDSASYALADKQREFLRRLFQVRKWPGAEYQFFNRVFLLEKAEEFFAPDLRKLGHRRPWLGRQFLNFLRGSEQDGFGLLVPLLHRQKFVGLLLLGQKADGLPYYTQDLRMVNVLRLALALMVRNQIFYEEARQVGSKAEAEVEKLATFISRRETIRQSVENRTFIYKSPLMANAVEELKQASRSMRPVLVFGETGTGKELMARLIHSSENTKGKPFIAVNCAAIPESLWEDEVFGHVKGAFTDARSDRAGLVEQAKDGTLFFDEIGEMPLTMQAKMLRLLQENKFTPLGGSKEKTAHCRFIFATNRDLGQLVEAKEFRQDLYYRINVFQIDLPPLRQRPEDIPALVEFYLNKFAPEFNLPEINMDQRVLDVLLRYDWPGNIRELENLVLRMVAGAQENWITVRELPPHFRPLAKPARGGDKQERTPARFDMEPSSEMPFRFGGNTPSDFRGGDSADDATKSDGEPPHPNPSALPSTPSSPAASGIEAGHIDFEARVARLQKQLIKKALFLADGNKTRAAEILGIKRGKLLYQIRELGLEDPERKAAR